MSVASATHKKTSRIYQDLNAALNSALRHTGSPRRMSFMDKVMKVFGPFLSRKGFPTALCEEAMLNVVARDAGSK